jgi:hypothetical protein
MVGRTDAAGSMGVLSAAGEFGDGVSIGAELGPLN